MRTLRSTSPVLLGQSKSRLASRAGVRTCKSHHYVRKWRKVRLLSRLKARRIQIRIWILLIHYCWRLTKLTKLIALPIRRPFLFLANLCAELGVLFLKLERYFLKLEKSRLKIRN